MVRVVPIEPPGATRRLGFLVGHGPIDFDVKQVFVSDIDVMFAGGR